MGKRKRGKRAHLKRFASDYINVYQGPNPTKLAEYHNAVKTVSGPKNNSEPVLDNSFTRPVDNGVAGHWLCSNCGKKFYTTVHWEMHMRKLRNHERIEHEPIFVSDEKKFHLDHDGVARPHKLIATPKKETAARLRVWQSRTLQGFEEMKWTRLVDNNKGTSLFLGFNGAVWQFKREYADGTQKLSFEYSSKEQAMWYWDNTGIHWKV